MKLYSCEKENNLDQLIPKELEDLSNIDDEIYTQTDSKQITDHNIIHDIIKYELKTDFQERPQ